jgi:hypothetical protein
MHELFNLTDQLTKFRIFEAKVSSKLEQASRLDRILSQLFQPQFTTLTTVYNTNHS